MLCKGTSFHLGMVKLHECTSKEGNSVFHVSNICCTDTYSKIQFKIAYQVTVELHIWKPSFQIWLSGLLNCSDMWIHLLYIYIYICIFYNQFPTWACEAPKKQRTSVRHNVYIKINSRVYTVIFCVHGIWTKCSLNILITLLKVIVAKFDGHGY